MSIFIAEVTFEYVDGSAKYAIEAETKGAAIDALDLVLAADGDEPIWGGMPVITYDRSVLDGAYNMGGGVFDISSK